MPDPRSPFGLLPNMRGAVDLSQRAGVDDLTKTMDVHDSEINMIHEILGILRRRSASVRNYDDFQREIIDRFAKIGFVVDVRWYETDAPGVLMPEINISARTETGYTFDRDKQVAEVTGDILGLGDKGTIHVDRDMMKALEDGSYKGESGHKH
jgi:hypothetical protein